MTDRLLAIRLLATIYTVADDLLTIVDQSVDMTIELAIDLTIEPAGQVAALHILLLIVHLTVHPTIRLLFGDCIDHHAVFGRQIVVRCNTRDLLVNGRRDLFVEIDESTQIRVPDAHFLAMIRSNVVDFI